MLTGSRIYLRKLPGLTPIFKDNNCFKKNAMTTKYTGCTINDGRAESHIPLLLLADYNYRTREIIVYRAATWMKNQGAAEREGFWNESWKRLPGRQPSESVEEMLEKICEYSNGCWMQEGTKQREDYASCTWVLFTEFSGKRIRRGTITGGIYTKEGKPEGNYKGIVVEKTHLGCVFDRPIGSAIFVRIYGDGSVILFAPSRGMWGTGSYVPAFKHKCPTIDDAKKYATCTGRTTFDIDKAIEKYNNGFH